MINNVIENTKVEYAIPVYNIDMIKNIPNSELQFSINDQLFLETLLMNIRGKTIAYSSYLKKKRDTNEKTLSDEIQKLEMSLTSVDISVLEKKK